MESRVADVTDWPNDCCCLHSDSLTLEAMTVCVVGENRLVSLVTLVYLWPTNAAMNVVCRRGSRDCTAVDAAVDDEGCCDLKGRRRKSLYDGSLIVV